MKKLNYSIYRLKYHYGLHLPLRAPVDVSLELSSVCNMHCTYCYHNDKKNLPFKQKVMPWRVAENILEQAADLGVNSIKTNWRGESTLNPNFERITAKAKSLASGSTFIDRLTNSNFKFPNDREDIFRGLCNQTKVKVSYDSFKKTVFEKQRAGGDHDITTANINKFYNYQGRDNELVIQAVRTQNNKDEDFETEISKRWPSATLSIRDVVEGRLEKDIDDLKIRERDTSIRKSCKQAHVRIIFDYAGRAYPCCPDIKNELFLGDINTKSLYDIFNGRLAKVLRKQLKDKTAFEKRNACKNCSSYETYKGFKLAWMS